MINMKFVVLNDEMERTVKEVFREHNDHQLEDSFLSDYPFSISIDQKTNMAEIAQTQYRDVDVLVARSMTAHNLKKRNYGTPIVEIPISNSDVILAFKKAVDDYGKKKLALVGNYQMFYNSKSIAEIMGLDIALYIIDDNSSSTITTALAQVAADKRELVIGGLRTCEHAREMGLDAVFIGMSKDSVWQAITVAKQSAVINHIARQNSAQFKTVLDHSTEGFFIINKFKNITLLNPAAEKLLGVRADSVLGKPARSLFPHSALHSLLADNEEHFNELAKVQDVQFLVNKAKIRLNNDDIGFLITVQDITIIQEAEIKIRNKMHASGYVARYRFNDIRGKAGEIRNAVQIASDYAKVSSNILLYGQSGTGKELFAQSIHNASARAARPFVAVNCAALPETLIESEFFGFVPGAFTGAAKGGKAGVFESAHKGTIFLDEISEIPLAFQGRLLRVLQEREIVRLGDDKVIPVDVRIICATNKDLRKLIDEGAFREDLYYRLNVLSLSLPRLRDCAQDIPDIAQYYLDHYCDKFSRPRIVLSQDAAAILQRQEWRGNYRELRNVCERLAALSVQGLVDADKIAASIDVKAVPFSRPTDLKEAKELAERDKIVAALQECAGNKSQAAIHLGISRSTILRKIKELGIE